jgi:hypothetical protein
MFTAALLFTVIVHAVMLAVAVKFPVMIAAVVLVGTPLVQLAPFQVVDAVAIAIAAEYATGQTPLVTAARYHIGVVILPVVYVEVCAPDPVVTAVQPVVPFVDCCHCIAPTNPLIDTVAGVPAQTT